MSDGGEYYRQRLEAELAAADQANDAQAALIHRALAARYRQLLQESAQGAGVSPQGAADPVTPEVAAGD